MMKITRGVLSVSLALSLALTSACADQGNKGSINQPNQNGTQDRDVTGGTAGTGGTGGTNGGTAGTGASGIGGTTGGTTASSGGQVNMLAGDNTLPTRELNGQTYVPVAKLAEMLGFNVSYDAATQKLLLGDNDANYELKVNSTTARKEEDQVTLKAPLTMADGATYLPSSALADLLSEDVTFTKDNASGQLILQPSAEQIPLDMEDNSLVSEELNFGDDPDDPYKNAISPDEGAFTDQQLSFDEEAVPVLKNINIPAMIARAKKYLGVKYLFGAGPYPRTGRFDCSTFTQYVYGKYGISLPRLSRSQAKVGTTVSRSRLRVGDLMFFYVPGRFKTNKTVGHVGIYIGNRYMIHSSPKPKNGVQITHIDKAYWKRTYLWAKRVAY